MFHAGESGSRTCLPVGGDAQARFGLGPVQRIEPTFCKMELNRTDMELNLDRTDFKPMPKARTPTDQSGPRKLTAPDRSVWTDWTDVHIKDGM